MEYVINQPLFAPLLCVVTIAPFVGVSNRAVLVICRSGTIVFTILPMAFILHLPVGIILCTFAIGMKCLTAALVGQSAVFEQSAFSVVSIRTRPPQSYSGSKMGQRGFGNYKSKVVALSFVMRCHFTNLPPEYISELREEQSAHRFTIIGILLDQGNTGMEFSLKPFCQNIYRTSELTGEQTVQKSITSRA